MLYFQNTYKEIQKLATYVVKSFQLLPLDLAGGCAPRLPTNSPNACYSSRR